MLGYQFCGRGLAIKGFESIKIFVMSGVVLGLKLMINFANALCKSL